MPSTRVRNIIFDLGNVLQIADLPKTIASLSEQSSSSIEDIGKFLLETDIIDRFDVGSLNVAEFQKELSEKVGWSGSVEELTTIWEEMLSTDDAMVALLRRMKGLGYPTYILSNINPIHKKMMDRTYEITRFVDGRVYSCECGMIKPDASIFRHTIKTFGIVPKESIFIDDKATNIRSATDLGFIGIQHKSYLETLAELEGHIAL